MKNSNVEIRVLQHVRGRYQTHILEESMEKEGRKLKPSISKSRGVIQLDKQQRTT